MMAPRRSAGNAEARIVRLSGMTMAAPRPWSARAATSRPAVGAIAQAAEAMVNSVNPIVKIRRRPRRSPRAAAVMMPAAKASVKALTVHSSVDRLACRSRWIAGRAVTTTSASRATMKKAMAVNASVQIGRGR